MKVLVTGANGFVGQLLYSKLSEKGYIVKGAFRSTEKITRYSDYMECVAVREIGPNTDWTEALKDIDTVIHLAARVHVMKEIYADSLAEYRKVNVEGTKKLAESATKSGVRRLIYISTIKVNGEKTENKPFSEDNLPNPHDAYAVSKWEAELVLKDIAHDGNLEIVILRPPLIYGPGVKANFLRILQLIDRGIPLPLMNVHNNRSLIYWRNLVDAICICISHPKAAGETFLMSDGRDISTPDLIKMIASEMGKKPKLISLPVTFLNIFGKLTGKSSEVERMVSSLSVDISKMRKVVNWEPPFTLEEGICETVKWYKNLNR